MAAVIGITMAEVVVLFPKTGGLIHVAKLTHGSGLSALITVLNLVVFIILPAIEVQAVLQYMSSYFGWIVDSDHRTSILGYVLGFSFLTLITLVNLYGALFTAFITKIVVAFKIITPALICFTFLYVVCSSGSFDPTRLTNSPLTSIPWTQVFQAIAVSGIIFSFNGFNQATLFAGEAKNPQKAIPFAILGSLLASAILYFLIQFSLLMTVPKESFANGWNQLSFSGDQGPFAGLAALLGLGWLLTIIYADAVISPLGTAFAYASAAPRLFYSLAEQEALQGAVTLKSFLKLNRHGVSYLSIVVTLAFECLAFILLPNLKAMIALLVASFVLCYTTAPASLLSLRRTDPNLERPFKVYFAPLVCYLSLLFSNLMVFSCGWVSLRNLSVVTAGLVVIHFVLDKKNGIPGSKKVRYKFGGSIWFLFQLCSLVALAYYDHLRPLPFATALPAVAVISFIALILSQRISLSR